MAPGSRLGQGKGPGLVLVQLLGLAWSQRWLPKGSRLLGTACFRGPHPGDPRVPDVAEILRAGLSVMKEMVMVDRIAEIRGTRTPFARDERWTVRVDQVLAQEWWKKTCNGGSSPPAYCAATGAASTSG